MDIVLAGRNPDKLQALQNQFSLPVRQVGLADPALLGKSLEDIATVVHMARPFVNTSEPMLDACLATRTNYIDITGEIKVFEALWRRFDEIQAAGITVVPGALHQNGRRHHLSSDRKQFKTGALTLA